MNQKLVLQLKIGLLRFTDLWLDLNVLLTGQWPKVMNM